MLQSRNESGSLAQGPAHRLHRDTANS